MLNVCKITRQWKSTFIIYYGKLANQIARLVVLAGIVAVNAAVNVSCCPGTLLNGNDIFRFILCAVWNPCVLPQNR